MMLHKHITIRTENQRAGRIAVLLFQLLSLFVTPAYALMQGCDEKLHGGQSCVHHDTNPVTPVFEDNYGRMPLVFEANQGQIDPAIKFLARGNGYNLYLASSKVTMALYQPLIMTGKNEPVKGPSVHLLRMNLLNANPDVRMVGGEELPGKSHYLVGNDPKGWYTGIRQYKNARYSDIYPGVDLVFYGQQNKIEYDFVIQPGASYKKIRLDYEGMEGMSMDRDGNLVLHTPMGDLVQHAPYAYQIVDGKKIQVQASYVLQNETRVGFQVRDYDANKALIIDPVLSYSTYLGGSLSDTATDIAVDNSGNAYITGYTLSADFDTASAMNASTAGGIDIFISKISADGSSLVYSTYLGGTGNDWAYGIAVDTSVSNSGVVAVTGATTSADFPVVSAIQSAYGGSTDGFVTKINAAGSAIDYSTYLGGASSDEAHDIVFNIYSQVYITGFTSSADFPVISGFQMTKSSSVDAFISKINTAGAFVFSSYLGGSNGNGDDYGYAVAVDNNDNAYVAGKTAATSFPTVSPLQGVYGGGTSDAFVAKIHPLGLSVIYATYLGGSGNDVANGIDVDSDENVYVAGSTTSAGFPVVYGGLDSVCGTDGNCNNGKYDAFVVKFSADGSALTYGTYIGGSADDLVNAIAVTDSGSAFVTGYTDSTDFPSISAVQATHGGVIDAFVARLDTSGTALEYSTFLGGSGGDNGQGIDIDSSGNVYVTGNTVSTDFPTTSPLQASLSGNTDVFIAKIRPITDLWVTMNDSIDPIAANTNFSYTIIATNNGPDASHSTMLTDVLPTGMTFVSVTSTQGSCSGTATVTCNLGTLEGGTSIIVLLNVNASQTVSNSVSITSSDPDSDTTNNIDSEQTVITTVNPVTAVTSSGGGGGSVYSLVVILMCYITLAFFLKIPFASRVVRPR